VLQRSQPETIQIAPLAGQRGDFFMRRLPAFPSEKGKHHICLRRPSLRLKHRADATAKRPHKSR
ncbi:hypothetical protein HMPREF9371_1454, partial [Neisseria shayeganii 871]